MKKILALIAVGFLSVASVNCERDDICSEDTPTTPRIAIDFYNNDVTTALKPVTITMRELGSTDTIRVTAQSRVYVPLRTDADTVTWLFKINPDSNEFNRTDTIQFNYTRNNIYVSRACGFKTVFALNDGGPTPAFVHTPEPLLAWMRSITVDNYLIETETDAHIRIFW